MSFVLPTGIAGIEVGKTIRQLRLKSRLKATQERLAGYCALRRKDFSEFHQFIISPPQHEPNVQYLFQDWRAAPIFLGARGAHHILSLADKTTMSGTCLMKECMRASQMEDVDLKDINVAVVEESARTINGIVPPSTSMEAPIEQVSTKQPISKLKGLPASSGPLKMSSESIDDRRPSMSLPQQQNGCLPGVNESSISFDNSGMNYPIYLPQVLTPAGHWVTNALENSNAASQKKPVVTPAQEQDTVRITRSTVSNTNGSTSESSKVESNQLKPSCILTTLPLLGGRTLRVVSYDLKKEAPKVCPGNYKPNPDSFGTLVHKMVSEVSVTNPDIIRWVFDGEAFMVNQDHPYLGNVLSKFFQHNKYTSFQRQLNTYGWNKCRKGRFDGAFYNCNFHRDRGSEQDLAKVLRRAPGSEITPMTTRKRSQPNRFSSTSVVSDDAVVSSVKTVNASRSAAKPLKKRSPQQSRAKPKPSPARGILKSTSSKKKPIDTAKASLDPSRMDSWTVLDSSHGEKLATNSAFQSVNSSLEPDMGRVVPTMKGNSAVSLDAMLNEKRWGKKALLRLHEPVKTRSGRRSALADVSNSPPKNARKSSLKPSTRASNKPANGLRKPTRNSLRSKDPDAGQGEARAVHFADPLPSNTPFRTHPGAGFLSVFVDEKSPTQMHSATNFPPAFANEDSPSQTHPGATFPPVFALEASMAYLLDQPLQGLSPNISRCPGWNHYSSSLEADTGAVNQPFGTDGLYSSMGFSSSQLESSERAHSPPSCAGFVSLSMDAARKIHFDGPLTQYASPIPVRVSLAPGCTVQMSPIKPSPKNREHSTESDQGGEKSPSAVITPSGLTTPSTIRDFEATGAQNPTAIVSQSISSIEERSPSAFVPVSISSSSMKRALSPSCLRPFLGWSKELSYALDLNDCLDDCRQVAPTPI